MVFYADFNILYIIGFVASCGHVQTILKIMPLGPEMVTTSGSLIGKQEEYFFSESKRAKNWDLVYGLSDW